MSDIEKGIHTKEEVITEVKGVLEEAGISKELQYEYTQLYSLYYDLAENDTQIAPLIMDEEHFNIPGPELIEKYQDAHNKYYQEQIEELIRTYEEWVIVNINSGMFGGKTSFVFLLLDLLYQRLGVKSAIFISSVMGEDFVTGRAYFGDKIRPAVKFGNLPNNPQLQEYLNELVEQDVDLVVLDEYTFPDPQDVVDLLEWAKENKKKVILLGLGTNFLGGELPILNTQYFQEILSKPTTKHVNCKSYTGGEEPNGYPEGEGTIRYLRINGKWIIDLGLGPLVISKENFSVVNYRASKYTLKNIIKTPFFKRLLEETPDRDSPLANAQTEIAKYLIARAN